MPYARTPLADRFNAKVDRSGGPEACWPFIGHIKKNGYGAITAGGKNGKIEMAHRVAYALEHGEVPDGAVVDHLCFNRACCNPAHLRAVSGLDNNHHRQGANRTSLSGVRNVHWYGPYSKWVVRCHSRGRNYFGGYFDDVAEAEVAAIALRAELAAKRTAQSSRSS